MAMFNSSYFQKIIHHIVNKMKMVVECYENYHGTWYICYNNGFDANQQKIFHPCSNMCHIQSGSHPGIDQHTCVAFLPPRIFIYL